MYPVDLFLVLVLVLVAHTALQDPPHQQPCLGVLSCITVFKEKETLVSLISKILNLSYLFYVFSKGHTIHNIAIIIYWGR